MNIQLITPIASHTITGNHITALRIRRLLKQLGHNVTISQVYKDEQADVLIALHALRSAESIHSFKERYPSKPVVVVLTGTDLYRDIKNNSTAKSSLEIADRLVVLQKMGLAELPKHLYCKTRVIYQSASKLTRQIPLSANEFNVCVIANLREEKDPFLTANAIKVLPTSSRIKVIHIGGSLNKEMEKFALEENKTNPRYKWLGNLSYHKTRRILANSHLLSITSKMEGSSNVLSEALASSVPII